jgi:hypothetical protein
MNIKSAGKFALVLTLSCFLDSCGGSAPKSFEIPAGCQPLTLSSCFLPFPSSFYEIADASTQSGVKVVYPAGVLPVQQNGTVLDRELFAREDGFSPATGILAYFGSRLDPSNLPSIHHPEESLTENSLVQLFRYSDGERIPLFAEVDAQAGDSREQALKIRPMKRLEESTRYVCVIKKGLKDEAGNEIPVPEPFKSLRDGNKTKNIVVEGYRPRAEENIKFLKDQELKKSDILLAWDFTTASEATITGPLVAMRDKALAEWESSSLGYTIDSVEDSPSSLISRRIKGKFQVPWFLDTDGKIVSGSDEKPMMAGLGEATFVVHIPKSVAQAAATSPVLVYGHGLFGTAEEEMWTDLQQGLADNLQVVQVGTDWIGVSKPDVGMVAQAIGNMNQVRLMTERIMQGHVNFVVLAHLVKEKMTGDPAFRIGGQPQANPGEVYYLGISNGGVQGGTFMALSPDVLRGVVNVPGAAWNLMLERSFVFKSLIDLLKAEFPSPLDRQIMINLVQVLFDTTDPINFAPHAVNDPLGTPKKTILVQESYGDALVPNLATETLARTMGLPGLAPLVSPVYGITEESSPLSGSGFTIFNTNPTPLPGDTNAPMSQDNIAHEGCRRVVAAVEQMKTFFKPDGQIVQTCSGSCDPGSDYVTWAPFP